MTSADPRVHVTTDHLRSLQAESAGLTFLPQQAALSVLNGRHGSRLRGRGLDFEEMRNYLPGDDVRSIDWKATARAGKPYVRVMTEERDRPTLLLVDQRISMFYGSVLNMKSVTAAEAAAIAAFRIQAQGDRVGGLIYGDEAMHAIHPARGQRSLNSFISSLASYNQALRADFVPATTTSLNDVLEQVAGIASHDHLIMVFSDFDGVDERTEQRLAALSEHNDLILMLVHDPSARRLRQQRPLSVTDGLHQAELDLANQRVAQAVQETSSRRLDAVFDWQKRINLSIFSLSAGEPTLPQIRKLMGALAPRRRLPLIDDQFKGLNLPQLMELMEPIVPPEPVAWYPQTVGWQIAGLWLITVCLIATIAFIRRHRNNRYRREALADLKQMSPAQPDLGDQIGALVKKTAIAAYTRDRVASLTGDDWAGISGCFHLRQNHPWPKPHCLPALPIQNTA